MYLCIAILQKRYSEARCCWNQDSRIDCPVSLVNRSSCAPVPPPKVPPTAHIHTRPTPTYLALPYSRVTPTSQLLASTTRGDGPRLVPPEHGRWIPALYTTSTLLRSAAPLKPCRPSRSSMGGPSPRSIEPWEMLARVK
jgi:hypothetical protein